MRGSGTRPRPIIAHHPVHGATGNAEPFAARLRNLSLNGNKYIFKL
jgi:hypothetical protein